MHDMDARTLHTRLGGGGCVAFPMFPLLKCRFFEPLARPRGGLGPRKENSPWRRSRPPMAAARAAARTAARPRSRTASRPRSRTARRPASRIRWDRVARTTLLIVLVVVLFSFLGPATKYVRSWQLARETPAAVRHWGTGNAPIERESKLLKDPGQVGLRARQMGMARPGERVYVVRGLPTSRSLPSGGC